MSIYDKQRTTVEMGKERAEERRKTGGRPNIKRTMVNENVK